MDFHLNTPPWRDGASYFCNGQTHAGARFEMEITGTMQAQCGDRHDKGLFYYAGVEVMKHLKPNECDFTKVTVGADGRTHVAYADRPPIVFEIPVTP